MKVHWIRTFRRICGDARSKNRIEGGIDVAINKIYSRRLAFLFLFLIPVLAVSGQTVIKAERIYTASGKVIENGMILIRNGKIAEVGKSFAIPRGSEVIKGKIVMPGIIDIHSHLGVYSVPGVKENEDGNEIAHPVTPEVRALDSFNFEDPALKSALAGGVTTIVSRPGSANVIGGTSAAVKLKDASPEQMVLKEICDLKMTIEGNPVAFRPGKGRMPTSLMGVYYLARKAFLEAREYMKKWDQYEQDKEAGKEAVPPERDLGKDALVMALRREIPVHIHVCTASEIMSCIRLADEFNLRLTLAHCQWAYLIKDELAKRKDVHFNVGPSMFLSYYGNALVFKNCPAILADAGANVSLQIDAVAGRQPGQRHLLHTAALCVRYGMKKDHALNALTIRAAEGAGLEKRLGSIEAGKDADLLFLDGEPFEFLTSVEKVMIDGRIEYQEKTSGKALSPSPAASEKGALIIPENIRTAGRYAIRAGTIWTMNGPPLPDGVIVVEDGKVQQVASGLSISQGIPVIDAREYVVMPGMITARSQVGISANWINESSTDELFNPVAPELQVKHAVEPQDPLFTARRKMGVTTIQITPGNRNVIGGRGVTVKTAGSVIDKMIVKDNSVMMVGLGSAVKRDGQMPSTRMGSAALLRQTLIKARQYARKLERNKENNKKGDVQPRDLSMEAMLPVVKGDMPVMFHCERQDDILTALRIADEFDLKAILTGAAEAHQAVDEIRKQKVPVILESLFRGGGNIEDEDFTTKNPGILSRAGIKINFTLGDYLAWYIPLSLMGADPLEAAAFAYKNGMSEEAALRAVTIDAAEIIGCDDRVGSLKPGKDADIVIIRGHPFKTQSIPEAVFIDGNLVYQRKPGEHM